MAIAARPTVYGGIQMRSRLEATVAGNLDAAGVRWTYEPGAFGGRGMQQWLPDFRLSLGPLVDERIRYVEVKGSLTGTEASGGHRANLRALMTRMAVAWESEPDAVLVIVEDGWLYYESNPFFASVWAGQRTTGWCLASFVRCSRCAYFDVWPLIGDPLPGTDGRSRGAKARPPWKVRSNQCCAQPAIHAIRLTKVTT